MPVPFSAAPSPIRQGRTTRKKTTAATSQGQLSAKSPSGPRAWARSMSQPMTAAATTSVAPTAIETASASATVGSEPRSTQSMNRVSRSGGGPSARAKASMRFASRLMG